MKTQNLELTNTGLPPMEHSFNVI